MNENENENMPLEIEKKFLIKMPDLEWIRKNTNCQIAEISQTYLGLKQNGFGDRVRKMTISGRTKFFHTSKKSISDMTRIEIEREISEDDYTRYLIRGHKGRTMKKTRYMVYLNNLKYEIDIYPFWNEVAILEIELKTEKDKYVIPDFIEVISDVTGNRDYSNSSLVNKYVED